MAEQLKAKLGDELFKACSKGDLDTAIILIKKNETSDPTYNPPFSAVMEAAARGDHAHIVSWCLERGATAGHCLMGIVIVNAFKTHQVLVKAKAIDIDYYISWWGTVLSVVATDGNYEWTKFCLENGANPNYDKPKPVDEYKSILAGAAEAGHKDIVELLLEHGAVLKGSGALVVAAEAGKIEMVEFLLSREGVDIDEMGVAYPFGPPETQDIGTALHRAAAEGHLDVVQLLVEKGAAINLEDFQGRTALNLAREVERLEIVDFLWSRGAI